MTAYMISCGRFFKEGSCTGRVFKTRSTGRVFKTKALAEKYLRGKGFRYNKADDLFEKKDFFEDGTDEGYWANIDPCGIYDSEEELPELYKDSIYF